MRPRSLEWYERKTRGKWKAHVNVTARFPTAASPPLQRLPPSLSPAVFHVLGLVHAYGQFNLQILVRTGLGYSHLVKLRLLGAVGSRVKDNLQKHRATAIITALWCHLVWYLRFPNPKEQHRSILRIITTLCSALISPRLSGSSLCSWSCCSVGRQRLCAAKVTATTGG